MTIDNPSGVRPLLALAFALTTILGVGATTDAAMAQGFFGGPAGDNCRLFQQEGGSYWQGFIRGAEESPFTSEDGVRQYTDAYCFRSEAECEDWLYVAQSEAHIVYARWCRPHSG